MLYNLKQNTSAERLINDNTEQISILLGDWSKGNPAAFEQLVPLVYKELHQMARRYMRQQSLGHTLQTTELIHESYLKMANQDKPHRQNRAHFFGAAAQVMRHILVDYARSKSRQKRGDWQERISFNKNINVSTENSDDIVALDEVLKQLSALDERKG